MPNLPQGFWTPEENAAAMVVRAHDDEVADLRRQLAEAKERYADIERRFEGDTLLDCLREAAEAAKGDNDV